MARRRHRGFTLIETVAAIVIMTIAVPSMLWAINEAHTQRVNPVMSSRARFLATEKLEDVIADRHSTTRGWSYLIPGNYPAEPTITGSPGFSRTVTLTETEADLTTAGTGYMKITVAVTWTDATNTARTLSVTSVATEYGP